MSKFNNIPQFNQAKVLSREQSEIAASKYIDRFNVGKAYGERIIASQVHTVNTIITDYWKKLKHKITSGRRLFITVGNLAKLCKCSLKTAYNHILRLIEARIIKKRFTLHKFDGESLTPCLELEINPQVLHFQVENIPVAVDNPVNSQQLELPIIPPDVLAQLRQLGIWPDSV